MDLSVFEQIAQGKQWGAQESISGEGSSLNATATIRRELPALFRALGIQSLVDAACGDMNWMRQVDYKFERFIGVDISPTVIERVRQQEWPAQYHFQVGNMATDIPPGADALLCRDALVHLPLATIQQAVRLWKMAGFRFLIVTTFTEKKANRDIAAGEWRPLNMEAAPFNWPVPEFLIPDIDGTGYPYHDKSLGVWRL
jgi:SAM-dependent methyltransferase